MKKKKITLLGAIMLGVGSIMGTGIFGTIPTVISQYREAVILALILAALNTVRASISTMYTSAAIPVSASGFMWAAKLLTLSGIALGLIIGIYVIGAVYLLIRIAYLRKKGVDVLSEMKEPFAPWKMKEAFYSQTEKL